MSRFLRKAIFLAVALFVIAAMTQHLMGQGRQGGGRQGGGGAPGAPAAQQGGGRGGGGMPQGGRGPIKMLLITRGHEFDRDPYWAMWDSMGADITWSHVEHPAADILMSPKYGKMFDVYTFFDLGGPGAGTQ